MWEIFKNRSTAAKPRLCLVVSCVCGARWLEVGATRSHSKTYKGAIPCPVNLGVLHDQDPWGGRFLMCEAPLQRVLAHSRDSSGALEKVREFWRKFGSSREGSGALERILERTPRACWSLVSPCLLVCPRGELRPFHVRSTCPTQLT